MGTPESHIIADNSLIREPIVSLHADKPTPTVSLCVTDRNNRSFFDLKN
jgi:hypothetical protein